MVDGRQGEFGRPLSIDRSGGEWRQIDQWAVSEEVAKVVAGAATTKIMTTSTEEMAMTEGE